MPPRQSAIAVERNFKKGLITEATGLNYPEDACVETYNCEFDILGNVTRRKGFNLETGYSTQTIDKTLSAINTYVWKNVTGDGVLSFIVAQIGAKLYFYDVATFSSVSAGYKTSTVDLTSFTPSGAATPRINECQFSDGFGKLFVVHPNLEAFYVTYDATADTFTGAAITVKIRDFEGLVDSLAIDNRPTATVSGMTKEHHYNLLNQGWNETVLASWDAAATTMPSNCDVWWTFKNASGAFDYTTVANSAAGNTLANKGHYILNLYSQDRSTASGVASITTVTTATQRASNTAFYAGRVWYTGINYPNFNSTIYFSQIVERPEQFGMCYQANDPTAEDLFSILPSDGGVIKIPEAGTVFKLFPMQSTLVVFASRGIWAITGNSGFGFSANDYTISKLSSFRVTSASSLVEVNGEPIFWTPDGILTVKAGQNQSGQTVLQVVPMSFTTIQSFYDDIPHTNKGHVKGAFNPLTQKVIWLYKTATSDTIEDHFDFDSILVYNALTGAFYPWSLPESDVKIHAVFVSDAQGAQTVEYTVVAANGDSIVDAAGDAVVAYLQSSTTTAPSFKFLVSYLDGSDKFTMADAINNNYLDWESYDDVGVSYESYFITGYKIRGQAQKKFQVNQIYFYNEGSGTYDVQGIWDYAITGSSGRYTNKQRLDFDDARFSNTHKRVRIRGAGRAMQLKISSVDSSPFSIIGWSEFSSGNPTP